MPCSDFVGELFLARDVAHSIHLNTRSFAKHEALAEFYKNIVKLADQFAEAYQGKYELIGPISRKSTPKMKNIVEFFDNQIEKIEKMRYDVLDKDCSPIQNIIDEILSLYYSTLYKLKYLA